MRKMLFIRPSGSYMLVRDGNISPFGKSSDYVGYDVSDVSEEKLLEIRDRSKRKEVIEEIIKDRPSIQIEKTLEKKDNELNTTT